MNEFDIKAAEWDKSDMHSDRARTVAGEILKEIPITAEMRALEFGAGTGLLSFLLRDKLKEITLVDNSAGMVKVLREKLSADNTGNMKVLDIDLEHDDYPDGRVDLIYTLMVLHHVNDVETIIRKFSGMLNPGGYLAIADLYPEDGSFHGESFNGHKGFDTAKLAALLEKYGFRVISQRKVYVIDKIISDNSRKQFEVFLMIAMI
ncbi:MAG: class I SAM-dependent methyltransferase [Bacteroidales bacterium]|jgi:ubiquinone/menaquinone biosynthesis C-methylase UbiE|nr:class I SAM-dependent methyltransferase [Bacteroidales bacterium]